MDYKKLSKLLYPEAKPVSYWEEKYPKRDLPEGAEVTRFAPSPTGYLHIGHFFQCVCDKFIAKNTNGLFYLRVEDTDKKREVENSIDVAVKVLADLGIEYDEGVMLGGEEKGEYGPYKQTDRLEIYYSYAKYLVSKGRAFPCFCKKADDFEAIEERRAEELKSSNTITEHDTNCRKLTYEEIEHKIQNGEPWALKLLSMGDPEKSFKFHDVVKGEREVKENSKDIVLLKSNGIPVYAFAHAVDDHLMGTTMVVRGEEWYSSLSAHIELFNALGFDLVKYAHNPVICKLDENGNKRKLSKRKDREADMRFFIKAGYPTEAIIEYLLNLANSNFEIWRHENPTLHYMDFPFDASKITSSNPMFDFAKLSDIAKNIIAGFTAEEVYEKAKDWAKINNPDFYQSLDVNKNYFIKTFNIDRDKPKPRKDLAKWEDILKALGFMVSDVFENGIQKITDYELEGIDNLDEVAEVLTEYRDNFNYEDPQDVWFQKIKDFSDKIGYCSDNKLYKANPKNYKGNVAKVCEYIRIAITGRKNSPDLYSICEVLGEMETKYRVNKFLTLLEKSKEVIVDDKKRKK